MAVGEYALITLIQLKTYMKLTIDDNDELLENLIDRTTSLFEDFTSRNLKARDYSYDSESDDYDQDNAVLDGNDKNQIILPQYPVNSVSTLRINEVEISARAGYTQGYIIDRNTGILRLSGYVFSQGMANIEIEYNAGYSSVPDTLIQACIEQSAWKYKQSVPGGALLGVNSRQLADGSVSYATKELLPEVRMVLEKYKKRFAL